MQDTKSTARTPGHGAHPSKSARRHRDKRTERVTVHLTSAELEQVEAECEERVKDCPGAKMSSSAFFVQLLREHRARSST